jgi:hypothetical protein
VISPSSSRGTVSGPLRARYSAPYAVSRQPGLERRRDGADAPTQPHPAAGRVGADHAQSMLAGERDDGVDRRRVGPVLVSPLIAGQPPSLPGRRERRRVDPVGPDAVCEVGAHLERGAEIHLADAQVTTVQVSLGAGDRDSLHLG